MNSDFLAIIIPIIIFITMVFLLKIMKNSTKTVKVVIAVLFTIIAPPALFVAMMLTFVKIHNYIF